MGEKTVRPRFSILLGLFLAVSVGCSGLKTRDEIPGAVTPPTVPPTATTPEGATNQPVPPPTESPHVRSSPKLGLILGAGGARTFAHVGFLKALETERIPVHAVVGVEWGALMAGLYAREGSVHNLEWQLFKMKDDDLPGQGLLTRAFSTSTVASLESYLSTAFGSVRVEQAKIPFSCPTTSLKNGAVTWLSRGSLKTAMDSCIPYPPLFGAKEDRVAAPSPPLEAAAQWLRRQGAEIVVLVDVVSEGDLWAEANLPKDASSRLLWWNLRQSYREKIPGVDESFRLTLNSYGVGDFQKRKTIINSGSSLSQKWVEKFSQRHGY